MAHSCVAATGIRAGGDPGGRLPDGGAQFRRVEDLHLGAEGEHVEHRDIGRVDPHPGFGPVLTPGNGVRAPASPDVGWPAEEGGEPPTARRQPDPGAFRARPGRPGTARRGSRREIAAEPVQQLEPAEATADRVHGDPCGAECLDIPQHGPLRYLKLGRELPGGHPAPGLQEAQQPDQPAGTHKPKIILIMTTDVRY